MTFSKMTAGTKMTAGAAMILALAGGFGLATPAAAQSGPICAEREVILATLATRYGETARSIGLGPGNRLVEVFASDETGSWSITVTGVNGTTCLVASGSNYEALEPFTEPEGEPL